MKRSSSINFLAKNSRELIKIRRKITKRQHAENDDLKIFSNALTQVFATFEIVRKFREFRIKNVDVLTKNIVKIII